MELVNGQLTLNHLVADRQVECIARCHVKLDPFEAVGLTSPITKGFKLSCILEGVDRNRETNRRALVTLPGTRIFKSIVDLINTDHVFSKTVNQEIINEDRSGRDEIRAVFTLMNQDAGTSVTLRSNKVLIVL